MTATGMAIGTPIYMAPEQVLAEDAGPWTDLYSVGVMTYEQIAGRAPFRGSDAPMVILMRHVNEAIPALREVVPDVDPALSDWVTRLLIKGTQPDVPVAPPRCGGARGDRPPTSRPTLASSRPPT